MDIQQSLGRLLAALPLHAEEGTTRQMVHETALLDAMGHDLDASAGTALLKMTQALFESTALLDQKMLFSGNWAFVSFPASLVARSLLATLSTSGQTLLPKHYWEQGLHQPASNLEEQRQLLHQLEVRRQRFHPTQSAQPIRTVHVAWGIIKIEDNYLLIRRDDKKRASTRDFGFPGGRLNMCDLPPDAQCASSLNDLFLIDSELAATALANTLARELEEECGLTPDQYIAKAPHIVPQFEKVEGVGNQHGLTQYNILVFPIQLNQEGELQLLQREQESTHQMTWFTLDELLNDTRKDGKRAFVDALKNDKSTAPAEFLQSFPNSITLGWPYAKETDAIDLPGAADETIRFGKTGKETEVALPLDTLEWGLLLLLAWHAKELPIDPNAESVSLLGRGWVRLLSTEGVETAIRLVSKLTKQGLPAPQLLGDAYCRLPIDPEHLFLSQNLFSYFLPVGDSNQCLTLTLQEVKTVWGVLQGKSLDLDLPRNMVRVIHTLELGKDVEAEGNIKSDNLQRLVFHAFQGIQSLGLRKFIYANKPRFLLAVVSSKPVLR